ncbi:unnamed protein product [Enterobius vermicularis]|uniref:Tetraspanin n=1 Tax=Enterobius vermicularis TaxID=51028 RepID=A0A0N4VRA8_ENTVE|nr:unnamed protein product [Enterobius vermicularis]
MAFFICGCGVALTCYIYKHFKQDFQATLAESLQTAIIVDHSVVATKSYAIEKLHLKGRCCGAVDFEDWRNSMWWQNANNDTDALNQLYMMHVPDFCCRTITPNCGQSDHPSNIFYKGCVDYLKDYFDVRFWSIYAFLILLISIQVSILCSLALLFSYF